MPVTRRKTTRPSKVRFRRTALLCVLVALGVLLQAAPAVALPIFSSAPVLSGAGRTLTTSNGSAVLGGNSYSYRWQRCNTEGTGCSGVPGEVKPSYLLTTADIGATVRSVVTATNPLLGQESAASGRTGTIVAAPPRNVVPPEVTRSGSVLTSTLGIWSDPSPDSVVYRRRWQRCSAVGGLQCQDVDDAVRATYTLTSADVGKFLRVLVSAAGLGKSFAPSAPLGPIPALTGGEDGGGGGGDLRKLRPFPRVIVAGRLARGLTFISGLTVRGGPKGATVSVRCRGRGCPRGGGFRGTLGRSGGMVLKRYRRVYGPGAVIEVRITKRGAIGKFTRLKVRPRSIPARRDACLTPGASKPGRCP